MASRHALQLHGTIAEVREGLSRPQKELPCKYLYDDVGSALFEVITLLPEYGLTRAGGRLLRRYAESRPDRTGDKDEIAESLPLPAVLVELGCGSGKNTRWLLEASARWQLATTYYPVDISSAALRACQRELGGIPSVRVHPLEETYLDGLRQVALRRAPRNTLLVLFLGGTIGNFDRSEAANFVCRVRQLLRPGDAFLLQADLVKPAQQLLPAYDDALGVTAAFNLNVLARLNRQLGADFDITAFDHLAIYDEPQRRVEMHLRSTRDQKVRIPAARLIVDLRENETIRTECSHRYTCEELEGMSGPAGFRCAAQWVDREWPFAQCLWLAE